MMKKERKDNSIMYVYKKSTKMDIDGLARTCAWMSEKAERFRLSAMARNDVPRT
jgi:hypothetical protein